jgi:hypothetical protein
MFPEVISGYDYRILNNFLGEKCYNSRPDPTHSTARGRLGRRRSSTTRMAELQQTVKAGVSLSSQQEMGCLLAV